MKCILTLALCLAAAAGFAQTGINTITPGSTFEVNGSEGVKTKTWASAGAAVYAPDATASVYVYTVNFGGQISLPTASSCPHRSYTLVNKTGPALVINGGYYSMSNTLYPSIAGYTSITIVSEDGQWQQIR